MSRDVHRTYLVSFDFQETAQTTELTKKKWIVGLGIEDISYVVNVHRDLLLASRVEQRDVGSGPAVLRRCASTLNSPRPAGFVKRCKVLA